MISKLNLWDAESLIQVWSSGVELACVLNLTLLPSERPVMVAQSWLMKLIAIELRLTALNRQRSHTQRLMRALLDDRSEGHTGRVRVTKVKGQRITDVVKRFLHLCFSTY